MTTLPVIGWQNHIYETSGITVTVSSEDTTNSYFKENAYDWTLATRWRTTGGGATHTYQVTFPGSVAVDCWGIAGHNLGDVGATVQLQYGGWTNLGSSVSPSGSEIIGGSVAQTSSTTWRLNITGASGDVEIGNIFFGVKLELEQGFKPGFSDPRLAQKSKVVHDISRNGVWIGSTVKNLEAMQSLSIEHVSNTWADTNWLPFRRRCQAQPFYMFWNETEYANSSAWCSAADFNDTSFSSRNKHSLTLDCRAETEP